MKTEMTLAASVLLLSAFIVSCGKQEQSFTGFLSDYSKLQKESHSSLRYVDKDAAAGYSGFIVDPVKVVSAQSEDRLTEEQKTDLANYLHAKIVEAVQRSDKTAVYQPAAGVARIRVALTDIQKSSAINIVPQASLLGAGIGGASIEAEIVDSITGRQIGAVVESGKGSRIPFANLGDWTAAKGVMDYWAERFQRRLTELSDK